MYSLSFTNPVGKDFSRREGVRPDSLNTETVMTDFFNNNPDQISVDPVYTGLRADALADGQIIDIGTVAQEAGFLWPLAVTKAVWEQCVQWTEADSKKQIRQSQRERLLMLATECAYSVRTRAPSGDRLRFTLERVPRDGKSTIKRPLVLQVVAHPGDDDQPVLTVMVPANC